MSNKVTDPDHPHYFFQNTYEKWVLYNNTWYNPREWELYYSKHNIKPEVSWYHDPLEVLKQSEDKLISNPTPDRLRRYFAFQRKVLLYFQHLARMSSGRYMGQ